MRVRKGVYSKVEIMNLDFLAKSGKSIFLLRSMSSDKDVYDVVDMEKLLSFAKNPDTRDEARLAIAIIEDRLGGSLPFEIETLRKKLAIVGKNI